MAQQSSVSCGPCALALMSACIIATAVVILHFNPQLLAERFGPRRGAKAWDVVIMIALGLTQFLVT